MMNNDIKEASLPHERMMINLAMFHLLLPVAAFSSGHIAWILSFALVGALVSIGWIAWKAKFGQYASVVIQQHWNLAWRHAKWLLISYGVSVVIMLVAWSISAMQPDHNMATIMLVVFSRIAAVPILLMVLLIFMLEMTALSDARKGA
ncbi:hypothetical protein [Methylophaga sp. UBA678]|uniref:hypothetical protein n=1 Tax=Methylophaga sp. UBA678 TaxID=1946901 RepID=UPI00259D09AD|nr:hypothetical protein [Methylophaga sp. UBA678]|tara:strand:+ start:230050 stop:230493 length:444 start_codon:yes stop_codon:yes gene_type:complete